MKRLHFFYLLILLSISSMNLLNAQNTAPVFKIKIFEDRGYYGIIDSSGNKLIKALKYDEVLDFSYGLARVKLNNRWGIINTAGLEITEIIYDEIKEFASGMAVVKSGSMYGAINTQGKEVTGLKYNYVSNFSGNIATVSSKTGRGYINKSGVELCPLQYSDADFTSVSDKEPKLFRVKLNGLYGYLDSSGKEIVSCQYNDAPEGYRFEGGMAAVSKEDKWGLINEKGAVIIPLQYEKLGYADESLISYKNNGKWGYLDKTGKIVIQALYDYVDGYFFDGICVFSLNEKYGILDKTGKVLVPAMYNSAVCIKGGLCKVELNGIFGVINKLNNAVIPLKYDMINIEWNNDKVYFILSTEDLNADKLYKVFIQGLADQTGKILIPVKYAAVWMHDDCVLVSGKTIPSMSSEFDSYSNYGIYSYSGQILVQPEYIDYMSDKGVYTLKTYSQTGMYFAKTNKTIPPHDYLLVIDSFIYTNNGGTVDENKNISGGKYSLFDPRGNPVTTMEYDNITPMFDNLCCVTLNGKMGFIDNTGKTVVDMKFDYIIEGKFSEGMATVNVGGKVDSENGFVGGKWGFINKSGQMVIPAEYEGAALFKSGMAAVKKDNLAGAIDKTGKLVIPFEYQNISLFENGIALYVKDNMCGFLDKTGKIIVSNIYQGAYDFSDGLAAVSLNNKVGFIDETGKVVIPFQYDDAESFENGYARVVKDNVLLLLDKKGTVIKEYANQ